MRRADTLSPEGPLAGTHDKEETRRKLLEAARDEFVCKGFHGARIEHIADRAGVNKALIYRYFGDRDALLEAVLEWVLTQRQEVADRVSARPSESLPDWYEEVCTNGRDRVLLLEREALEAGPELAAADRRAAFHAARIEAMTAALEEDGGLAADLDPRYAYLALTALVLFPVCFPQLSRLITGEPFDSPAFKRAWNRVLVHYGEQLRAEQPAGS